jgi:hypothetical protein
MGFRDFPGLLAAKENRNGSRQTLPFLTIVSAIPPIAIPRRIS